MDRGKIREEETSNEDNALAKTTETETITEQKAEEA